MRRGWTITDTTRTLTDGTVQVLTTCPKCGGTGYLPGLEYSDNARCWECMKNARIWVDKADADRIAARREAAARRAARKAEEAAARAAADWAAWKDANAELIAALSGVTAPTGFLADMRAAVDAGLQLTPAQVEATTKALADAADRAARETDAPEGRVDVEGVVMSLKEVADNYSYYERYITKVVVDCGTFRLYGTLPAALGGVEKGTRVAFTATVTPKERGFGIFKRPTKARVLDA